MHTVDIIVRTEALLSAPAEVIEAQNMWLKNGEVPLKYLRAVLGDVSQTVSSTVPGAEEEEPEPSGQTLKESVRQTSDRTLLISDLGWSREEALETYARLRSFEEDWNAPGMEAYDDL